MSSRTLGNAAGTQLVTDLVPGHAGSDPLYKGEMLPDNLAVLGQYLLFAADDGKHGVELWRTDGTAAGTILVKQLSSQTYRPWSTPRGRFLSGWIFPTRCD